MNLTEVKNSLDKMFAHELRQGSVRNIVFQYDGDGAYADKIDSLELDNVKVIKLDDRNAFAVKLYIEKPTRGAICLSILPCRCRRAGINGLRIARPSRPMKPRLSWSITRQMPRCSLWLKNTKRSSVIKNVSIASTAKNCSMLFKVSVIVLHKLGRCCV